MTLTTFPPIADLLPHAPPMVLVDELIQHDAESVTSLVHIHKDAMFFETGKGVPAWVGIEYMAQTIAAWAGLCALQVGGEIKIGFLLGTRRYQTPISYFPEGCTLTVRGVRQHHEAAGLSAFDCHIHTIIKDQPIDIHVALNVFQPDDPAAFLAGQH
ncbi:MAG: 3-hydroxylacyl-ACP dehydratase [Gammaproteobacteria bacterium]|nr:3-hydroxylacyl-ACP dehydratase [Gammaproteobacteria bacterium]